MTTNISTPSNGKPHGQPFQNLPSQGAGGAPFSGVPSASAPLGSAPTGSLPFGPAPLGSAPTGGVPFPRDFGAPQQQGLPSESELSRLANEFFMTPPGATSPAPTPPVSNAPGLNASGLNTPTASPPGFTPPGVGHPGVAAPLPYAPHDAPGIAAPSTAAPQPQAGVSLPGAPSTLNLTDEHLQRILANSRSESKPANLPGLLPLSTTPSFYFLKTDPAPQNVPAAVAGRSTPATTDPLVTLPGQAHRPFDVESIRRDFPILQEQVNGRPLVWLDNAATTQKPQSVIDRITYFYQHENSNIHRAAHELAARSTDAYEGARNKIARFLNASTSREIVFVRGATEAINLVAQSWGRHHVAAGDEIVITHLEHHANIVPWQMLAQEKGAHLRVAPVDDAGQIRLDEFHKLMNSRTKLVAFPHVSNALGTITPAREMVEIAHRYGARVLIDGAQAVSHLRADVQSLNPDWYVFSGHKVFGPTGIGVLYGKEELLNSTQPWQGGGNMIQDVTFDRSSYQQAPARFEAGTGNIADAVGLGAAIDYVDRIGIDNIARYEHDLLVYATAGLQTVPGLTLYGTASEKASVLSFCLKNFSNEDIGKALSSEGIAVRAGHHCAQPILRRFGQESTVRPSLAFYNTHAEVDYLVETLRRLQASAPRFTR